MDVDAPLPMELIDAPQCDSILSLDQQLKRLREEIELKLHDSANAELSHFMKEIDKAIQAITHAVTLASIED